MWDLASNQHVQVAQHQDAVRTVHSIQAPNYSCIMTGSWDKTLKVSQFCHWLLHCNSLIEI